MFRLKILSEIAHLIQFAAIILLLTMAISGYALVENPESNTDKNYAWSVGDPLEVEYWLVK